MARVAFVKLCHDAEMLRSLVMVCQPAEYPWITLVPMCYLKSHHTVSPEEDESYRDGLARGCNARAYSNQTKSGPKVGIVAQVCRNPLNKLDHGQELLFDKTIIDNND